LPLKAVSQRGLTELSVSRLCGGEMETDDQCARALQKTAAIESCRSFRGHFATAAE
jgi:hypothetical protein